MKLKESEKITELLGHEFADLKISIRNGRMVDAYERAMRIEEIVDKLLEEKNVSSD